MGVTLFDPVEEHKKINNTREAGMSNQFDIQDKHNQGAAKVK